MKTKELIKQLREADPTGEEEVTVGNTDIHFVDGLLPSYYDGCQQILILDEKNIDSYNVIGGKVRAEGNKVVIRLHSISDAIFENPKLPVDYSELVGDTKKRYKANHDKMRKFSKDCNYKLTLDNFIKFIENRIPAFDKTQIKQSAQEFFDRNSSWIISEDLPQYETIKPDGSKIYASWNDRQQTYWNDKVFVSVFDSKISIERLD